MLRSLTWKETRELLPLVVLALLAQGLVFLVPGRLPFFNWMYWADPGRPVPFVGGTIVNWMLYLAGLTALALGLWQTLWESGRGTFLFLLHRPMSRSSVFTVKLAVGIATTLLVSGLPILTYALWAALPGTHASPFFWSMTTWAWLIWFRLPLIYLGAFLSGMRPGRWFGTRAFPLLAALLVVLIIAVLARFPLVSLGVTLLVEACFLWVIYCVVQTRDYS